MSREHRRQSEHCNLASKTLLQPLPWTDRFRSVCKTAKHILFVALHPLSLQCAACCESSYLRSMKTWAGELRVHPETPAQNDKARHLLKAQEDPLNAGSNHGSSSSRTSVRS
jgi:hypothetical protein